MLWTNKAQLHQHSSRVQVLSWHTALPFHEAELHQQTLRLLWRRRCSCHLLWAKNTQLRPKSLRVQVFVVALCFATPQGRASPAGTAPAAMPALYQLFCSGPSRPIFTRRHCDIGICRDALLFDSRRPSFASRPCGCCNHVTGCALPSAPPEDTATLGAVVALCFAYSGGRASPSPTDFATVGTTTSASNSSFRDSVGFCTMKSI